MHKPKLLGVKQQLVMPPGWGLETDGSEIWAVYDWKRMSGPPRETVCIKCGGPINGGGPIRSLGKNRISKGLKKLYAHQRCL